MGIEHILDERAARYGIFSDQAVISQRIKSAMADTANWSILPDDMREALEMVAGKIARILNGDFTYTDSVIDIIGYMQLVLTRMEEDTQYVIQQEMD